MRLFSFRSQAPSIHRQISSSEKRIQDRNMEWLPKAKYGLACVTGNSSRIFNMRVHFGNPEQS
jgi:hypothetical protein